jgi:hypothetical protein
MSKMLGHKYKVYNQHVSKELDLWMQVVTLHYVVTIANHTLFKMAHQVSRFLSRRLYQQSPFQKISNPAIRTFRAPKSRSRTYATGSGPNPRPGQSPFKVWPFIAITLVGSGAYALMVRSREGKTLMASIQIANLFRSSNSYRATTR